MFQPLLEAGLRGTMHRFVKPVLSRAFPLSVQRRYTREAYRTSYPPKDVSFAWEDLGDVPVLRASPEDRSGGTVLYFHGGGYVMGSADTHRGIAGHLAKFSGCDVLVPDYRLAPEHPFPAAPDDAEAVYLALINQGVCPGSIALAGDSAGGGLALACIQTLRDSSGILPGCAALISPHIDLSDTGAFSDKSESMSWYTGNYSRDHPGASPLFGEMNDLPPTLIHVASDEEHVNEANRLMVKLLAADVRVDIQLFDDAFHVFHMFTEIPESLEAIREVAKFFRQHI